MEIKSVKKISEGEYVINDEVKVSNFHDDGENSTYEVSFTSEFTQKEAEELASKFVYDALTEALNKLK